MEAFIAIKQMVPEGGIAAGVQVSVEDRKIVNTIEGTQH